MPTKWLSYLQSEGIQGKRFLRKRPLENISKDHVISHSVVEISRGINKQQTTNNKQHTTNNNQQTTYNKQQPTNNIQQTTNNKQQTNKQTNKQTN